VRAQAIACCVAFAISLAAAAPVASARPSTSAERVAAANAFAHRTLSFDSQQRAAEPDALRALAARRAGAQGCLAAWQSAPLALRDNLAVIYFEYLSGALWSVDAPLFRHWITDLRRSKRIDRSPVLARAADALRRDYSVANTIYTAVPDACVAVTRWRDTGWSVAARPALLGEVARLAGAAPSIDVTLKSKGAAQLVRYARSGKDAAAVLKIGVDEPDARVNNTQTGCDHVGALVMPDVYDACPPAS
jgi:hypothetical protein